MAFSGGVYTLPTPALVPGQIVSSSENNTVRNDMAASFNLTWLRNGTAAATANIPMGSFKLTGLGAATTSGDALSYGAAAVVTTLTSTSLTATRVPYAGTGGLLQDASTFTFDGTTLTAGGFTTSGAISAGTITASGAITVSGGTANGVAYLNGSKVLTTGSALTFDGTNLGLGTTYAGYGKFTAAGSGYTALAAQSLDASGVIAILAANSSNEARIGTLSNHPVAFYLNNSEQMRLTSTGLGIGTSSPTVKLQVQAAGATIAKFYGNNANNYIEVSDNNGTNVCNFGSISNGNWYLYTSGYGAFYTGGSEKMRLDSSGNLGLGVTPSATSVGKQFEVGFAGCSLLGASAANTVVGAGAIYNSGWLYAVSSTAVSVYQQQAGVHKWYTAPSGTAGNAITFTQAMTLDASGNLGLGTSSPAGWNGRVLSVASSVNDAGIRFDGNLGSWGIGGCGTATGSNALRFYNFTASSEAMRIDSAGNVGIGTSSPSGKLHVEGTVSARIGTTGVQIYGTGGSGEINSVGSNPLILNVNSTERMRIDSSGNVGIGTSSPSYKLDAATASGTNCYLRATSGAVQTLYGASTGGFGNVGALGTIGAYDQIFFTNSAERMRLDSSGNLLVGKTTNADSTVGASIMPSGRIAGTMAASTNAQDTLTVFSTGASAYRFYLDMAGTIHATNTTISAISDKRYKENVRDLDVGLDAVLALKPRKFDWKEGKGKDIKNDRGFIAQEFEQVFPDLIDEWKDPAPEGEEPYKSVRQDLIPVLVKAIQELKAELDATKAEVAALKGN